ncbi:MAG: hypothetical protein AB1556_02890 [Bacillota bacterium]
MKIKFTCFSCGENFVIHIENLTKKSSLACPNCENPFPQGNFEALKKISSLVSEASEGLTYADREGNILTSWEFKLLD